MTSPMRLVRLVAVALVAFVAATRFEAGFGGVIHLRNFYGALQIRDAGTDASAVRTLYNGRTLHGVEFLAPDRLRRPTAYYGPDSGVGRLLLSPNSSDRRGRRVGLVGLGVGTLAAYGRHGDTFRFYEINPAVIEAASRYFHFLGTSQALTDVVEGDGRLALQREPPDSFDVLVLDAFADDSIPVHLLTREAFGIYFRLLRRDGVLAIHLTNRFLDLAPVVEAAAANLGRHVAEVHSAADPDRHILAADWAVVQSGDAGPGEPTLAAEKVRMWTDDYSNLFQVLR
jgi:SAM-dependent methyltransferase